MDTVLIIGVEGAAGAGLASVLKRSHQVVGISNSETTSIDGCRVLHSTSHNSSTVNQQIKAERPDWIIFCGAAARSSWDSSASSRSAINDDAAITWSKACDAAEIPFCMISSDAIFTGPWMSHAEDDEHHCETPQAERLRQIEADVLESNSEALIVRTNAFGWSSDSGSPGFAEEILSSLDGGLPVEIDFLRHSAPILTTELGHRLIMAYEEGLKGVLHIAGSERMNPFQFAERLAECAGLEPPQFPDHTTLETPVTGFGKGETTLDCSLATELLGSRMPSIDDGIDLFVQQAEDGFLEGIRGPLEQVSRVA